MGPTADPPAFNLLARTGHPVFIDFPWDRPLSEWDDDRLVDYAKGVSRHVVRFVAAEGRAYALKETSLDLARREYRLLRWLAEEGLPAVEGVGVVSERRTRTGKALPSVLITRHLEFSLPYRMLFAGRGVPDLRSRLIDALAVLLVRLHLAGFFWGDCSLSNVLFRRDAGALLAYLVDAETGEQRPDVLSDGQRRPRPGHRHRERGRRAARPGRGQAAALRRRPAGDGRRPRAPLHRPVGRADHARR